MVTAADRAELDGLASARKLAQPAPLPVVVVMESQATGLLADQPQPAGAVTATESDAADPLRFTTVGVTPAWQVVLTPDCVMFTATPPTVIRPVRADPAFCARPKPTQPGPLPVVDVIVIQLSALDADQLQPAGAVTDSELDIGLALTDRLVGVTLIEQLPPLPACAKTIGCPATVIVPVRTELDPLAVAE